MDHLYYIKEGHILLLAEILVDPGNRAKTRIVCNVEPGRRVMVILEGQVSQVFIIRSRTIRRITFVKMQNRSRKFLRRVYGKDCPNVVVLFMFIDGLLRWRWRGALHSHVLEILFCVKQMVPDQRCPIHCKRWRIVIVLLYGTSLI